MELVVDCAPASAAAKKASALKAQIRPALRGPEGKIEFDQYFIMNRPASVR
ncbi:MAG: hypothetical protein QM684_07605 [Rhizobium sp.]|uniref:hypothetical protein n=1 Tax=Rhizobium sp. SYY.PMSO TaxID=3382192 RepID=UPI00398FAC81